MFTQLLSLFVKTLFSAPVYSLLLLLHHGNTKCFQEICIFRVFAFFCCINSVDYLELSLKSGEKSLFLCEWNGHLDCVTIHLKLWPSKSDILLFKHSFEVKTSYSTLENNLDIINFIHSVNWRLNTESRLLIYDTNSIGLYGQRLLFTHGYFCSLLNP